MRATPSRLLPDRSGPSSIQQAYVTHCLFDEGLSRQAGFAVRATSTRDPLPLRFAREYPPYQLPAGFRDRPEASPVRLALVRVPGGPRMLVHSVPLPADQGGRANNFFSHCLFTGALDPRAALSTWGSPDWAFACPPDTGKDLEALAELPAEGVLTADLLSAFLQTPSPKQEALLGPLPLPERLFDDVDRCRELLGWVLRGCLRVLQPATAGASPAATSSLSGSVPAAGRGRLFILGESPLVALLLYGAARLLPPPVVANLTFSTYENSLTLRNYRHAPVIGTWTANPGEGLDPELFTTRGLAIDTYSHRCSAELNDPSELALDEWIELAARGDWKVLDKVYSLLGSTSTSAVSFREGFQAAKLVQRLTGGKGGAADLLALKRSSGSAILEEHGEKIWPLIRDLSLTDPQVREEFADLLARHQPELEQDFCEALQAEAPEPGTTLAGKPPEWEARWQVLKVALGNDPARLKDALNRLLPQPPYPPTVRFGLLRELRELGFAAQQQGQPLHTLLRRCSPEDLEEFARTDLPRDWFVWALCYAIVRVETRAAALRYLQAGDEDLLRSFWDQILLLKDKQQRRAILAPLLDPHEGQAVLFLGRSLTLPLRVQSDTLRWMLETVGALRPEWNEFWSSGDHLSQLLTLLRDFGDEVQPIWDYFTNQINGESLLFGNHAQQALLTHLAAARDRPGPPIPAKTGQLIRDWVVLRDHFERASAVPDALRREVIAACQRLRLDAVGVLRTYFYRFVLPHDLNPGVLEDFAGFFHSFYSGGTEYQDYGSRTVGWVEILRVVPDEQKRAAYREYYLEHHVPAEFRSRLVEELPRTGPVVAPRLPEPPPRPDAPPADDARPAPETSPAHATLTGTQPALVAPALSGAVADELFQVTGVRAPGEAPPSLGALLRTLPWQFCGFVGGVLALLLLTTLPLPTPASGPAAKGKGPQPPVPASLAPKPPPPPVLYCLLPLVVFLADGMAVQALTLGLLAKRHAGSGGTLRVGWIAGAVVGVCAALLTAGVTSVTGPSGIAVGVAVAVALGVLAATALGLLFPGLAGRFQGGPEFAHGPVVRALAGVTAVGLYVLVLRVLVRA